MEIVGAPIKVAKRIQFVMIARYDSKKQRRSHRKSRLGCQPCKKRKIKCDEARPICLNCIKRKVACSFPSHSQAGKTPESSSNAGGSTNVTQTNFPYHRRIRFVPSSYTSETGLKDANKSSRSSSSATGNQAAQLQILSQRITSLERRIVLPKDSTPKPTLAYADMELLHHYYTVIVPSMSHDGSGQCFWRDRLPMLGFQCHHLLHLMLALAAIHKSRLLSGKHSDLVTQANRHHLIGIQGTLTLMNIIDNTNCEAVHLSAVMLSVYNLALGPKIGEYIGFSDHGEPGFLVFMRGVRSVAQFKMESLAAGTPSDPMESVRNCGSILLNSGRGAGYAAHFEKLRVLAVSAVDPRDHNSASIHLKAINDLESFFCAAYCRLTDDPSSKADTYAKVPFAWLYQVSDEFIEFLQHKSPLALAIFACFTVLLKELDASWIIQGWPEHILFGVCQLLQAKDIDLVRWPMEQIGWKD